MDGLAVVLAVATKVVLLSTSLYHAGFQNGELFALPPNGSNFTD